MRTDPPDAVLVLDRLPSLGPVLARGVVGSARAAVTRARTVRPDALPRTRLLVRGVQVDADHLTTYQHLVGEVATDALPAGFVHVVAFPLATALLVRHDFPLPLLGMVHVANAVEQRRRVRLGEPLDVRVLTRDLRAHRAGVTVDVVAEVSVADEVVWSGVSTYLAKGIRLAPDPTRTPDEPDAADNAGDAPDEAADAARDRTFTPPLPTGQWRLPADVGRRYAAVSGDRNPIHLSSAAAKAFGFPRTIAHGMYTASRALADVGPARGEAFRWDVEFAKPVLLPSTVTVRVARDDSSDAAGYAFVGWDARTGRRHLSGTVSPFR